MGGGGGIGAGDGGSSMGGGGAIGAGTGAGGVGTWGAGGDGIERKWVRGITGLLDPQSAARGTVRAANAVPSIWQARD
jgi:hypothetical protein